MIVELEYYLAEYDPSVYQEEFKTFKYDTDAHMVGNSIAFTAYFFYPRAKGYFKDYENNSIITSMNNINVGIVGAVLRYHLNCLDINAIIRDTEDGQIIVEFASDADYALWHFRYHDIIGD
jgi:hypothetical protein